MTEWRISEEGIPTLTTAIQQRIVRIVMGAVCQSPDPMPDDELIKIIQSHATGVETGQEGIIERDKAAIEYPRLVVCAIIIQDGKVLLERRAPAEVQGLDNHWDLPGGKVEKSETPQVAVIREIREELAVEIQVDHLLPEPIPSQWTYKDGVRHWLLVGCVCRIVAGNAPLSDNLRWFPIGNLPSELLAADRSMVIQAASLGTPEKGKLTKFRCDCGRNLLVEGQVIGKELGTPERTQGRTQAFDATVIDNLEREWMAQKVHLSYTNWLQAELLKARAERTPETGETGVKFGTCLSQWCPSGNHLLRPGICVDWKAEASATEPPVLKCIKTVGDRACGLKEADLIHHKEKARSMGFNEPLFPDAEFHEFHAPSDPAQPQEEK